MALRLEDYALIGDTRTCALVGVDGSIDWLCLPRFDSGAVFAALLGTDANGRWQVAPDGAHRITQRRYRPDTLVLETEFATGSGRLRVVDCMVMHFGTRAPSSFGSSKVSKAPWRCAAMWCFARTTDRCSRGFGKAAGG